MAIALFSGCAAHRTNSTIEFDSTNVKGMKPVIPVGSKNVKEKNYTFIEKIVAIVKKNALFHDSPTKKHIDIVLAKIAKDKGQMQ